jgi:hypothetical protein
MSNNATSNISGKKSNASNSSGNNVFSKGWF